MLELFVSGFGCDTLNLFFQSQLDEENRLNMSTSESCLSARGDGRPRLWKLRSSRKFMVISVGFSLFTVSATNLHVLNLLLSYAN